MDALPLSPPAHPNRACLDVSLCNISANLLQENTFVPFFGPIWRSFMMEIISLSCQALK
jgi:hypothetical protein